MKLTKMGEIENIFPFELKLLNYKKKKKKKKKKLEILFLVLFRWRNLNSQ